MLKKDRGTHETEWDELRALLFGHFWQHTVQQIQFVREWDQMQSLT